MGNLFAAPRSRSASGLVLAVVIIPFLLALLACLPVPIGNPERSRIDPAMTGVWVATEGDIAPALWLMEPYDARTWLVTWIGIDEPDAASLTEVAPPSTDPLAVLESEGLAEPEIVAFKGWLTKIRGTRFLVLEPKMVVRDEAGMTPEVWFVFAVGALTEGTLELRMLNHDLDAFDDAETSADFEAAIKREIDNPRLLADDLEKFVRIPASEYARVEALLNSADIGV